MQEATYPGGGSVSSGRTVEPIIKVAVRKGRPDAGKR